LGKKATGTPASGTRPPARGEKATLIGRNWGDAKKEKSDVGKEIKADRSRGGNSSVTVLSFRSVEGRTSPRCASRRKREGGDSAFFYKCKDRKINKIAPGQRERASQAASNHIPSYGTITKTSAKSRTLLDREM